MADKKVALITGIVGEMAQGVGKQLHEDGFEIVGVDYRRFDGQLDYPIELYRANYNKTKIEDIFRHHEPSHVLHLGRVGNLKEQLNKRFDLNVIGSRKVLEQAQKYGARRAVILSTFHIYGAHPSNHIPIYEEDPLRAGTIFPQIADAIQLDSQATSWLYQQQSVRSVVLRPCNVIGRRIKNAMSRFLRQSTIPFVMGFDPMTQFLDERDLTEAIVAAMKGDAIGVYNVANAAIPLSEGLRAAGGRLLPVPGPLAEAYLRVGGVFSKTLPFHLVDFFRYPCVIADDAFRSTFDWSPNIAPLDSIRDTVAG